jgi:DNA-binding transcriptional regulator YhcF (GntR family)
MGQPPVIHQLKFKKIENEIRQLVKTLPVGSKLLSERDLAVSYKCNFLTVRRALKNLADDGLIVRRVGSGTFVTDVPGNKSVSAMPKRENRVGVLIYQNGDDYANKVLQALSQAALEKSVELRSTWITSFDEKGIEQARQLVEEGCSALILPWFPIENAKALPAFVKALPVSVSLPMPIPGLEDNCFEDPHVYGSSSIRFTTALCRYFRLLGHERIALLGPDSPGDTVLHRKHLWLRRRGFDLHGPVGGALGQIPRRSRRGLLRRHPRVSLHDLHAQARAQRA